MSRDEELKLATDGRAAYRIYWVPQVPMTAFHQDVPDYATGVLLCSALAAYDLFQLKHNVKPDYCNAGGVQWNHPDLTEGEWWDLDEDEAADLGIAA